MANSQVSTPPYSIHPHDSRVRSAGSILESLNEIDTHSEQLGTTLDAMVRSKDYNSFISALHGPQITRFLDFLDRALDAVTANLDLHKRSLRFLRKICGLTLQLPPSHVIPDGQLAKDDTSPVGRGGNADVWTGSFQRRRVAIKCLRIYGTDDWREVQKSFCKEVVIWKRLSHPNMLPLLGVSNSDGQPCMVSEWMENGNIVRYLEVHPGSNRLQLLLDIAKGLEYLHSCDVVHGDLKGANIVIDAHGRALLADFGLSSLTINLLSLHASTPNRQGGIVRWMAPELLDPPKVESSRPTKASDIYAFSMLVIEVFSGNVPFSEIRDDSAATFRILEGKRPERPSNAERIGLIDDVWEMVRNCWCKDPLARPNATEVARCLEMAVLTFDRPIHETVPPLLSKDRHLRSRALANAQASAPPALDSPPSPITSPYDLWIALNQSNSPPHAQTNMALSPMPQPNQTVSPPKLSHEWRVSRHNKRTKDTTRIPQDRSDYTPPNASVTSHVTSPLHTPSSEKSPHGHRSKTRDPDPMSTSPHFSSEPKYQPSPPKKPFTFLNIFRKSPQPQGGNLSKPANTTSRRPSLLRKLMDKWWKRKT